MSFIWTTAQGEKLDVRWMDSVHIVHCVNMLVRKNDTTPTHVLLASNVGREMQARDLVAGRKLIDVNGFNQFEIAKHDRRETIEQLCMYNALREHNMLDTFAARVRLDPKWTLHHVMHNHRNVWTTYCALRLTR